MRCGKCKTEGPDVTVEHVRSCYGVAARPATSDHRSVAPKQVVTLGLGKYDVPAGYYAVESATGNNDLDFFRVDKPTDGKWRGYTFVKRVVGGHSDIRIRGTQAEAAMQAIVAAGPFKAGQLYGQKIGRCYKCHRSLTDETSRQLGIGPECRKKAA